MLAWCASTRAYRQSCSRVAASRTAMHAYMVPIGYMDRKQSSLWCDVYACNTIVNRCGDHERTRGGETYDGEHTHLTCLQIILIWNDCNYNSSGMITTWPHLKWHHLSLVWNDCKYTPFEIIATWPHLKWLQLAFIWHDFEYQFETWDQRLRMTCSKFRSVHANDIWNCGSALANVNSGTHIMYWAIDSIMRWDTDASYV